MTSDQIIYILKKNRSLKFGIRCYDTKYTTLDSNMVFFMANPYLWRKSNKKKKHNTGLSGYSSQAHLSSSIFAHMSEKISWENYEFPRQTN